LLQIAPPLLRDRDGGQDIVGADPLRVLLQSAARIFFGQGEIGGLLAQIEAREADDGAVITGVRLECLLDQRLEVRLALFLARDLELEAIALRRIETGDAGGELFSLFAVAAGDSRSLEIEGQQVRIGRLILWIQLQSGFRLLAEAFANDIFSNMPVLGSPVLEPTASASWA